MRRLDMTHDIATDFTTLCRNGDFELAGEKYWSPDVVSIEAMEGADAVASGLAAVRAKSEWWYANHEVHSVNVEGPYVNGNQFTVRFTMDITPKATGERMSADEVGLYTVKDGKIIEERFFYGS
jgi:ketosteroid isomerase-like protein